jgi:uncharacterized protein YjaZ
VSGSYRNLSPSPTYTDKQQKTNGGKQDGVVRTDLWLEERFSDPVKMCTKMHESEEEEAKHFYQYLRKFGMYKPGTRSKRVFEELKKRDIWTKVEHLFQHYRKKWNGPEIPIYIFPMDTTERGLMMNGNGKAGVSFEDKMVLFLTPMDDEGELKALFVHEYHHICRMKQQKKSVRDYTLLDSMVLEGLAEHAVAEECGEQYTGKWSRRYSQKELEHFWKSFLSRNLSVKREQRLHDELLFGIGRYPGLMGYAMGYEIISQYKNKESFTAKASFQTMSEKFTKLLKF